MRLTDESAAPRSPDRISARRPARLALTLCAALAVAGCGGKGLRSVMSVQLEQPDEFKVLPHAPLQLPASFDALPAPTPGAESPLAPRPVDDARAILSGGAAAAGAPSAGELALLERAGAEEADPAIRRTLEEEEAPGEARYGLTELFGYQFTDPNDDQRLSADEESLRLQQSGTATPASPPRGAEPADNELLSVGL